MAIYSTDKAKGLSRDLCDRLRLRLENGAGLNTVREAQDAQGWPMLFISHGGNEAEAQSVMLVRIKNIDNGSVDIFGNSTLPFAPHQAQVACELNGAGAPIPTTSDFVTVNFEVTRMGTIVQEYSIANGTAVTEASLNAASPTITLADIDWSDKGNV